MQPAASAGATLAASWFIGQFHGVISTQTPTGSRTRLARDPDRDSQSSWRAAAMVASIWPGPQAACELRDRSCGAPISVVIAVTISS